VVTEVGRQPWIIYGYMRTADAVTPMPGLVVPFTTFTLLYVFLSVLVVALLMKLARSEDRGEGEDGSGGGDTASVTGAAGAAGGAS
jgi:cytochrome d ubiquinol oxidase subunit I